MMQNKENNINNLATLPLPHFWRNPVTWRSTNTGMNQNAISTYNPYSSKKDIIKHIRKNIIPYTDKRKYVKQNKNDYFADIVNDCMKDIWKCKRGFVFTYEQLKEVMRILPSVNVEWSEYSDGYYCWK